MYSSRGFKWEEEDYDNPEFMREYIHALFIRRVAQIYNYLLKVQNLATLTSFFRLFLLPEERKHVVGQAPPQLHIVSFSCGPCTDAVALVLFFRTIVKPSELRIKVTLIDPVERWRDSAVAAVESVLAPDNGDSVAFIRGDWETKAARDAAVSGWLDHYVEHGLKTRALHMRCTCHFWCVRRHVKHCVCSHCQQALCGNFLLKQRLHCWVHGAQHQ